MCYSASNFPRETRAPRSHQGMATEVEQVLCMNGGQGDTSYANNSKIQKRAMFKAKPMLEESITKLYCNSSPECLRIADLGCSSGPNTLSVVWKIIDIIDATCKRLNRKAPMFQFFLNDLPGNDFNTIFKSLPSFYEKLKEEKGSKFGPCFIAGIPGSFYGRLFPNQSLHFVHSSYSLHWRSQVPEQLVSESGVPLNKRNICMAKTSPSVVHKAYLDLFERDFTLFLTSRSEEIVPGGHMLLIIVGNDREPGDRRCTIWELLGLALNDMVQEGLIVEEKLDQFNLPYYAPTPQEARHVIQTEGSFNIQKFDTHRVDWDADIDNGNKSLTSDRYSRGKNVAKSIRAIAEPILATHFGNEIMDDLFERFAKKILEYLKAAPGQATTMVISMTKA